MPTPRIIRMRTVQTDTCVVSGLVAVYVRIIALCRFDTFDWLGTIKCTFSNTLGGIDTIAVGLH